MNIMRTVLATAVLACAAMTAVADDMALGTPEGAVVLTISGDIAKMNDGDNAVFDVAMLEQIGTSTFETTTIWTDGTQQFEGVLLTALMATLDVEDGTLVATAVNDYSIELPVVDENGDGPIVAFRQNGEEMSVRDKGPLWIVYPYDSDPVYKTEVIYARSIWQLDRIEVRQ